MAKTVVQETTESNFVAMANIVVKFEGLAFGIQRQGHAQQRGDSDAAGQQHGRGVRPEREQISRRANRQ